MGCCERSYVIPAKAGIQGVVGIIPIFSNHAHHSSKAG